MDHANRAATVLTKSVALITKSSVPMEIALIQPRLNAQLLHAQLRHLLCALTDNVLLLSPTVNQLSPQQISAIALEMPSETSFLALTVLALPLLNNADLSFLAKISSLDAMMVLADQPPANAHRSTLVHHQEASDALLASAHQALTTAHLLLLAAQVISQKDARRPGNVSATTPKMS